MSKSEQGAMLYVLFLLPLVFTSHVREGEVKQKKGTCCSKRRGAVVTLGALSPAFALLVRRSPASPGVLEFPRVLEFAVPVHRERLRFRDPLFFFFGHATKNG